MVNHLEITKGVHFEKKGLLLAFLYKVRPRLSFTVEGDSFHLTTRGKIEELQKILIDSGLLIRDAFVDPTNQSTESSAEPIKTEKPIVDKEEEDSPLKRIEISFSGFRKWEDIYLELSAALENDTISTSDYRFLKSFLDYTKDAVSEKNIDQKFIIEWLQSETMEDLLTRIKIYILRRTTNISLELARLLVNGKKQLRDVIKTIQAGATSLNLSENDNKILKAIILQRGKTHSQSLGTSPNEIKIELVRKHATDTAFQPEVIFLRQYGQGIGPKRFRLLQELLASRIA